MNAVARELSPSPMPRLVPPRPTPKSSFPPPLPPASTLSEEVYEVSDTSIHDVVALREESAEPKPAPKPRSVPPPLALVREPRAVHPGLVLARTIGFFVAHLAL